jgi:predicted HicB family RNase H-like nuclease
MNDFKFTATVPEEVRARMDDQARAAEVSRSEWVRRAILAYSSDACRELEATEDVAAVAADRDRLAALLADRDQEIASVIGEYGRLETEVERLTALLADRELGMLAITGDCGRATAEAERLRSEVMAIMGDCGRRTAEIDRLRADFEARETVIARAQNEIAWLRALTERLAQPSRGEDR